MSHLILTTNDLAASTLRGTKFGNVVLGLCHRFVWGRLPSEKLLKFGLEPRSAKHSPNGDHWLDDVRTEWLEGVGTPDIGLFDLSENFDSIEVWVDPRPNDQLLLVWLLDLLRPYKEITTKLSLVHTDAAVAKYHPDSVASWKLPVFKITENHLALASHAWHAWRSPTPEPWYDLLARDLTGLPRLRPAVITMLEELPDLQTGLGENEMGMLGWIEDGGTEPMEVLSAAEFREVFDEREAVKLLRELVQCPAPAIVELDGAPLDGSEEARPDQQGEVRLVLTDLGRAVLAGKEDFSRHNPICRWWGGTELTNERIWRWDARNRALVTPR